MKAIQGLWRGFFAVPSLVVQRLYWLGYVDGQADLRAFVEAGEGNPFPPSTRPLSLILRALRGA